MRKLIAHAKQLFKETYEPSNQKDTPMDEVVRDFCARETIWTEDNEAFFRLEPLACFRLYVEWNTYDITPNKITAESVGKDAFYALCHLHIYEDLEALKKKMDARGW